MIDLLLDYLYRIIITIIILVPALTGILVAGTIIYSRDFKKKEPPFSDEKETPTKVTYRESITKDKIDHSDDSSSEE